MKRIIIFFICIILLISCKEKSTNKIKVGIIGDSEKVIWQEVINKVSKDGIKIELITFGDYLLPNQALNDGDLDLNNFQHHAFFDNEIKNKGYNLTAIADTCLAAMNIYSQKISNVNEIKRGDKIAIPNDPSNGGRALKVLEAAGLIKLKDKSVAKTLALVDGTKVKLSQGSVLLYPASFEGKERKVFLAGEAFFDIKHDDKHPFHVSTPHFEITDLGTSFSVSSYTTDEEVTTTLKTGKIELRIVGEDKVYSMNPDDQLVYNVKTKSVNLRQVSKGNNGLGWRNKQIDLNDVTLAEAAQIMGDAYGVKFSFRSQRYKNTKVTVHFNRGETLSGAMNVLKNLVPGLEYEVRKDEVILK